MSFIMILLGAFLLLNMKFNETRQTHRHTVNQENGSWKNCVLGKIIIFFCKITMKMRRQGKNGVFVQRAGQLRTH